MTTTMTTARPTFATTQTMRVTCLAAALACAAGCNDRSAAPIKQARKTAESTTAPRVWKKIASMNLEVEVAANVDVQDKSKSAKFPTATIYAMDGTVFLFGSTELGQSILSIPKDIDAAKTQIQKRTSGFKRFTKEAPSGETFILEYESESTVTKKPLYGIIIRRRHGTILVDCSADADTESGRQAVATLCNSARAAH